MSLPVIAIVGAPNAGKSTLYNRLIGRRKALVHGEPGMTRDINEESCEWDGRGVTVQDTGGLFPSEETPFAGLVRRRVLAAASRADLLVFVVDGRQGLTPLDRDLATMFRQTGRPVILVVNKLDVPGRDQAAGEFHALGFPAVIPVSAEHDLGLGELREAILELLPPRGEPAGEKQPPAEVRLAIAGRPNVGKSSLLNALIGEDRSLVSEVPGTTRDAIDVLLRRRDRLYRIIDTAGIRRRGKAIEKPESLSVMSARRSVEAADVVLLVLDASEGPTAQDLHVAQIATESARPFVILLNKWDLRDAEGPSREETAAQIQGRFRFAPWAPLLTISARTGLNIGRILPLVDRVHAQAHREIGTGRLNAWLRKAVTAHRPPAAQGRELRLFYVAQTGVNPPAFLAFTNSRRPPHFSYQRYLENSLRDAFDLSLTPVVLRYRERPRRPGSSGSNPQNRRQRAV